MSSRSNSPTNRGALAHLAGQGGAFSPFMFGMIMGVTVFSALSMQYAKKALADYQTRQTERARANAQDIASAMDFAIATETRDTYNDTYSLDRARQYSESTGKTRGDADFQVTTRQGDGDEQFGRRDDKVAITASDDALLRGQVARSSNATELTNLSASSTTPVAVYDTSVARDRQIRTSAARMSQIAEQLYAYYAANLKFPDSNAYDSLVSHFGLRDAWGEDFEYSVAPDQQSAQIGFTTPWNYHQELNLSLKGGPESSQ
ncbi:MAG: hypothetical protein GC129_05785 [Proteobacteria bacterium]|nr:hypothetical protein [Pseudomonadota bacterium]